MARPRYVVRTGTVEHWKHNVDYPMPASFTRDREGGMAWFRAMRDMSTVSGDGEYTQGPYHLKLVLVERTRQADGSYTEVNVETWISKPLI
jgi:hypothetical protein